MKSDAVELILLCALVLALFFLFRGEPDIWDGLHAAARARLGI